MIRIKVYILLILSCTFLLSTRLPAQNNRRTTRTQTTTIEEREVVVTRDYERSIKDADRIAIPLATNDSIAHFTASFNYRVMPSFMPVFTLSSNIEAAEIAEQEDKSLKNYGYLRIGAGYPIAPMADLYLHNLITTNSVVSIYYNHRSYWANTTLLTTQPEGYSLPEKITGNNALHNLGFSIQHRIKNTLLHATAEYKHRSLIFHGHDTAYLAQLYNTYPSYINAIKNDPGYIRKSLGQTYNMFNAEVGVTSRSSRDGFSYNANVTFGYTGDKAATVQDYRTGIPVTEYTAGIYGKIAQTFVRTHSGSISFNAMAYNKGNVSRLSDGLFVITPSYEYQKDGIAISVGVNLEGIYNSVETVAEGTMPKRDSGRLALKIHPNISFTGLLTDYFTAYARLNGKTEINTYQKLALENPYILPGLVVENTTTPFEATLGGKGRVFDVIGYNLFGAYSFIDSMYFYVNSKKTLYPDPGGQYALDYLHHNFEVIYNRTNQFTFGADIDYTVDDFEAIFRGRYYIYTFNKIKATKAWHKPTWELNCDLRYNYDDWIFRMGVHARGETPILYQNSGTGEIFSTIKPYVDVSLQAEYNFYKWLTGFVYGNNLINQKYQNYYLYYHHGLSVGAGVSMSF